jgi:hypothetical protein
LVLTFLTPSFVLGQITGGQVPRDRILPLSEDVEGQLRSSRYNLGPLHLTPKFSLQSTGYVNNIFGTSEASVSDYTATASLGTLFVVPFGQKVFFRGTVLPSYIWYARNVEGRKFGWVYDNSLLLLFNRLSIEAKGNSSRSATVLNSETEQRVLAKSLGGVLNVELQATGHVYVVGGAEAHRYRFTESPPAPPNVTISDPGKLDRTELAGRGGLRYRFSEFVAADLQAERTRTTFVEESAGESQTTAYLLGIRVGHNRLSVNLSGGYRQGRPYNGSAFPEYSTGTGSYGVTWKARERLSFFAYGHRSTEYSQYSAYYFEARNAGGVGLQFGARLGLQGFGEFGSNQYPGIAGEAGRRRDDVRAYGGQINFEVSRGIAFNVRGSEDRYTSNRAGFSRNIFRVIGGLTIDLVKGVTVKVGAE